VEKGRTPPRDGTMDLKQKRDTGVLSSVIDGRSRNIAEKSTRPSSKKEGGEKEREIRGKSRGRYHEEGDMGNAPGRTQNYLLHGFGELTTT